MQDQMVGQSPFGAKHFFTFIAGEHGQFLGVILFDMNHHVFSNFEPFWRLAFLAIKIFHNLTHCSSEMPLEKVVPFNQFMAQVAPVLLLYLLTMSGYNMGLQQTFGICFPITV